MLYVRSVQHLVVLDQSKTNPNFSRQPETITHTVHTPIPFPDTRAHTKHRYLERSLPLLLPLLAAEDAPAPTAHPRPPFPDDDAS